MRQACAVRVIFSWPSSEIPTCNIYYSLRRLRLEPLSGAFRAWRAELFRLLNIDRRNPLVVESHYYCQGPADIVKRFLLALYLCVASKVGVYASLSVRKARTFKGLIKNPMPTEISLSQKARSAKYTSHLAVRQFVPLFVVET